MNEHDEAVDYIGVVSQLVVCQLVACEPAVADTVRDTIARPDTHGDTGAVPMNARACP
jgi:hypothetical protein